MLLIHRSIICCSVAMLCACRVIPQNSLPAGESIAVGHPEVFDNAQLQTSLDTLRGQLAALGIVDTGTLTGALGAVQGTSVEQSNFSLQAVGRATPSVTSVVPSITATAAQGTGDTRTTTTAAQTPAVPVASSTSAAPTLPAVASDSIGIIEKQMQLESQLQGYELLLGGSDFARYTISGLAKDRVVIGFPITISAQDKHKNMAAEVELTYFPPNANQFEDYYQCAQGPAPAPRQDDEERFSKNDGPNAEAACREQEATPTIINILPAERSYNVVGVSSKATSFGAAAIVGTVSVGASGGWSKQTQYLLAQQDTVALQGEGLATCEAGALNDPKIGLAFWSGPGESIRYDPNLKSPHCFNGAHGVRFKWQFKPVLGESFVRPGRRVTFVQLAIPNVRRPYPNYGGIVYVRKTWRPIDTTTGVVKDAPLADSESTTPSSDVEMKYVLGHTFIASEVSSVAASDLGSGSVLVSLQGTYLTGARVRVGGTILNTSSPGFITDYNSLQFITTAQALAQTGATLISSEGVESPIDITSLCKSWDEIAECTLERARNQGKLAITGVSVSPVSDSTSLIKVELAQPSLSVDSYHYFHYQKKKGDVPQSLYQRVPDTEHCHDAKPEDWKRTGFDHWPIVLTVGGKTYGFSDLPLQSMTEETASKSAMTAAATPAKMEFCGTDGKPHDMDLPATERHVYLSVVATNDSINSSPNVRVSRLFGNPSDNSDWRSFVPPGRLTMAPDPTCVAPKPATPADSQANNKHNKSDAGNKDQDKDKQKKAAAG